MTRRGLQAFHYRVTEKSGGWFPVVFYASNRKVANAYAKRWAEKLGHARVQFEEKGPA